jgi:hypothetical protein
MSKRVKSVVNICAVATLLLGFFLWIVYKSPTRLFMVQFSRTEQSQKAVTTLHFSTINQNNITLTSLPPMYKCKHIQSNTETMTMDCMMQFQGIQVSDDSDGIVLEYDPRSWVVLDLTFLPLN